MTRTVVEVSPGPSLPTTFSAQISQPAKPQPAVMPPVALVEIETAAELIPGPIGPQGPQGPVGPQGSPDTAAQVLEKLVTVDGPGSLLDADLLDGQDSTYFATQASQAAQDAALADRYTKGEAEDRFVNTIGDTMAGKLTTAPSNTTNAGLNLPHGAAPSSPVNGDIWSTTTNLSWRQNGATYNAMNLNGAQTVSGIKTFSEPPIMTTPSSSKASIRLPHGSAPSAPLDGDMWSTSGGLFARLNGATINLANTFPEAPNDGQQYARQSLAWAAVAIPPGTIMQDTPPSSPQPGQFWFDTDSGGLFLWFNDGSSSQWIQVNGTGLTGNPAKQTFTAAIGSQSLNIPVPPGAKMCRLTGRMFINAAATTLAAGLRMSLDGSTFYSGASDYVYAGQAFYNGSSGSPVKIATTTAAQIMLVQYSDSVWAPLFFDAVVGLVKLPTTNQYFSCHSRGWSFHSAATAGNQENLYTGYTGNTAFNTASEIKALQIVHAGFTGTFGANSFVTAEWSY